MLNRPGLTTDERARMKELEGENRVREAFFLSLKQAKLRRIRFHDLRHSFASWLISNGESLAYVKERLGTTPSRSPWIPTVT